LGPARRRPERIPSLQPHDRGRTRTLGQDLGGPRQDVLRGKRLGEPGERGEDLVGGRPISINESVRQALHPVAHRLKGERNRAGLTNSAALTACSNAKNSSRESWRSSPVRG